ncbi:MAG TPA: hypothetical protein VL738_19005 [Dactylosporangium sp.]|nr:hypothetical protein [Dactylosporangium sp.]
MADEYDNLFDAAFAGFSAAAAPHVKLAGMDPVRRTVRHRRTVRVTVASAVAVIAVIAPVAAFAARDRGDSGPPLPGGSASVQVSPPPESPSPSVVIQQSPPESPRNTDTTPPSAAGGPPIASTAVDCAHPATGGLVSAADLCNLTFTLPAEDQIGPCPTGKLTFKDGKSGNVQLLRVLQADLGSIGDGRPETVGLYYCGGSDPGTAALVVFDRVGADIRAVDGFPSYSEAPGAIRWVEDLGADGSGELWLRVSDRVGGGMHPITVTTQWRIYQWGGDKFKQVGGSTSFTSPDRGVTVASTLRAQPASGSSQHGALTVTVRNTGSAPVADVSVRVLLSWMTAPQGDCPVVPTETGGGDRMNLCSAGTLAPGASKTFTLRYDWTQEQADAYAAGQNSTGLAMMLFGDQRVDEYNLPPMSKN